MTNQICPYLQRTCRDEARKYDVDLCYDEGNFRNCGMYQKLTMIQNQVEQRTPERMRNIVSILTERP